MNRPLVLAVLCLREFTVNVDTTLVNVALPTLVRELDAGPRELQWIVDAYTLTFAALVLACGALSDRYGRREALVAGLVVHGTGNLLASFTDGRRRSSSRARSWASVRRGPGCGCCPSRRS